MDIPVITITLNTDTDPADQHSEWYIHQTLPAPARNKQVGLLVAERVRELFPCAVVNWKKPYSWTLASLLDSSGAAYLTIRLIL